MSDNANLSARYHNGSISPRSEGSVCITDDGTACECSSPASSTPPCTQYGSEMIVSDEQSNGGCDECDTPHSGTHEELGELHSSYTRTPMSRLRSTKTVLTRRAGEWMQTRLAGLTLPMFCAEKIVIFSTLSLEPPDEFRGVWHFICPHHQHLSLVAAERHVVNSAVAVLIFCDTMADDQMQDALDLAQSICTSDHEACLAPPIILLHHSMAPELHPEVPELEKFDRAALSEMLSVGIDDIIPTELSGLKLAAEVCSRIVQHRRLARNRRDQMTKRSSAYHRFIQTTERVHDFVWEYLRLRLRTAIPRIDGSIKAGLPEAVAGFLVREKLGKGGMGTVHRLVDPTAANSTQALKVLKKEKLTNFYGIASLKRLISISLLLSTETNAHPNIGKFYEVYHTADRILFRMEDAGQINLFTLLGAGPPLLPQGASSIIKQCIDGLHHMHTKVNVVHRDVKPENLLISERANVYIVKYIDFDISRRLTPGQLVFGLFGTFPFFAPEASDSVLYDAYAADVWSLGVTFLEVLCGTSILKKALSLPTAWSGACLEEREVNDRCGMEMIGAYFTEPGSVVKVLECNLVSGLASMMEDARTLLEGMLNVVAEDRWAMPRILEASTHIFCPGVTPEGSS